MRIELRLPEVSNTQLLTRTYDSELDDIRSILVDVCRSVEKQGQFVISGFGQDPWPVDVGTDLVIFLEQLPTALHAIASGVSAEIELYEQGIERTIAFSAIGDHYVVSCASHGVWQPDPSFEQVDRAVLEKMLLSVQETFMSFVRGVSPGLAQHQWVQSWLAGGVAH